MVIDIAMSHACVSQSLNDAHHQDGNWQSSLRTRPASGLWPPASSHDEWCCMASADPERCVVISFSNLSPTHDETLMISNWFSRSGRSSWSLPREDEWDFQYHQREKLCLWLLFEVDDDDGVHFMHFNLTSTFDPGKVEKSRQFSCTFPPLDSPPFFLGAKFQESWGRISVIT